jgi:hypothetical protein
MDIEDRLRESLAAREPDQDFDARVMARITAGAKATPALKPQRRFAWRVPAAIAATVFAAAFGLHWYSVQQREAHARDQLLLALQITSFELNQVQQKLVRTDKQENGT